MNFVYLLRCADGSLYCGWTTDPEKRLAAHSSGHGAKYTRSRLPAEMAYLEVHRDRHAALSREWHIKRMSRAEKEEMIRKAEGKRQYMTDYPALAGQAEGMLEAEPWYVAAFSNISALIMETLPGLNWAGFYLMRDGALVVGPFQGKPACIRIAPGKGVCGTAAERNETVVVPDVHLFPGHIACDSASESEIVVPVRADGRVRAVLDIDSPVKERFGEADRQGLEALVRMIEEKVSWN